jgi:hypothetical protein
VTGDYSRVTAILSFYDETLDMLAASVSSLVGVADHLVAVDGAYMLYPDAKPSSDPQQMRLIAEICSGARIGLTTHTPIQVWGQNEVQKRSHALMLAEAVTDPNGWYLIHDADCVVTSVHPDFHAKLEELAQDDWGAVEVGVKEIRPIPGVEIDPDSGFSSVRLMYRALRGMVYGPSHWSVHAPDPESGDEVYFWGPGEYNPVAAYNGTSLLRIEHRVGRPEYRRVNALKYYQLREELGVESFGQTYTRGLDGKFHPLKPR